VRKPRSPVGSTGAGRVIVSVAARWRWRPLGPNWTAAVTPPENGKFSIDVTAVTVIGVSESSAPGGTGNEDAIPLLCVSMVPPSEPIVASTEDAGSTVTTIGSTGSTVNPIDALHPGDAVAVTIVGPAGTLGGTRNVTVSPALSRTNASTRPTV